MVELKDVVAYLCQNYPHKFDLSKGRLTKMVYLADWYSAIDRGYQLTDIKWIFNHYGPYVEDVVKTAQHYDEFDVVRTRSPYGNIKDLVRLRVTGSYGSLSLEDRDILDSIISITADLKWDEFMRLVYSTYPVLSHSKWDTLDLVALAKEYNEVRPIIEGREAEKAVQSWIADTYRGSQFRSPRQVEGTSRGMAGPDVLLKDDEDRVWAFEIKQIGRGQNPESRIRRGLEQLKQYLEPLETNRVLILVTDTEPDAKALAGRVTVEMLRPYSADAIIGYIPVGGAFHPVEEISTLV